VLFPIAGAPPRSLRLSRGCFYLVVIGKFGEVLPHQDEHTGVVTALERGRDLLLLTLATTHRHLLATLAPYNPRNAS
jgi:hypothetical protein